MAEMEQEELARRKRVDLYKKIIVCGFWIMVIVPVFTSIFLFCKVKQLEKELEYARMENGKAYQALNPDRDALLNNPEAESGVLVDSVEPVLGDAEADAENETGAGETSQMENGGSLEQMQSENTVSEKDSRKTASGNGKTAESAKRVYLTFDDGPSQYTGEILDILAANNVKASFFVIGKDEEYYESYRRIVEEGHTIGMHSYSHVYENFYASEESFAEELTKLNDLIYDVTGVKSSIFRFPGGSSNNVAPLPIENYIEYLNENHIAYYDWNALNGDAVTHDLSPEQLVSNIMNDVEKHEDSIVLMHDLQTTHATVESLQLLIDTLKAEGYEILPIDENTPLIQHVASVPEE